jgi:peptidoglycan/xylan/chitin deacetylase (PgdA/CDA1 family)
MTRAFVSSLMVTSLLLAACSSAPVKPAPASTAPPVQPPVSTPVTTPEAPKDSTPSPAPGTGTATAPAPTVPAGTQNGAQAPVKVDPQPAIKWYPRGIGLPLKSGDPAAEGKKVVVLTFDDGPSDTGTTVKILDTLAEHNVKAMFFITGYGAKNTDLVKRIHAEGHVLGPHTMTHPNLAELNMAQQREEIAPLNKLIEEVSGEKPKWLRPPFGGYNDDLLNLMKEEGMEVLTWTNGSLDWDQVVNGYKDPNQVVKDVMDQLHPGAVVLFHDTLKHTAEALPEILKQIKAEGYEFTVLPNK